EEKSPRLKNSISTSDNARFASVEMIEANPAIKNQGVEPTTEPYEGVQIKSTLPEVSPIIKENVEEKSPRLKNSISTSDNARFASVEMIEANHAIKKIKESSQLQNPMREFKLNRHSLKFLQ
nr:mitochondrial inner membrane protein mitofilin [Tanacetum cinerariifolium]